MSVQYCNVMFTLWMRINLTHFGPVSYGSQDPFFPFINSLLILNLRILNTFEGYIKQQNTAFTPQSILSIKMSEKRHIFC